MDSYRKSHRIFKERILEIGWITGSIMGYCEGESCGMPTMVTLHTEEMGGVITVSRCVADQ